MSSLTLPQSGGMRNGELYELPTLAHRTTETACSCLPTPRAQNGERRNQAIYRRSGPQNLENALALLPTPTVMDMGGGRTHQQWLLWLVEMREKHKNGNGHGRSLFQELLGVVTSQQSVGGKP